MTSFCRLTVLVVSCPEQQKQERHRCLLFIQELRQEKTQVKLTGQFESLAPSELAKNKTNVNRFLFNQAIPFLTKNRNTKARRQKFGSVQPWNRGRGKDNQPRRKNKQTKKQITTTSLYIAIHPLVWLCSQSRSSRTCYIIDATKTVEVAGIAQWLERRASDRKVAG